MGNKSEIKRENQNIILCKEKRRILQIGTLLAGVAFVTAGVYRGEAAEVMNKAVRICLECIGIA